jgi:hypothetical protein
VFGTDAIKHLFTFYHFCRTCQHFLSLICSMLGISGAHYDHINSYSHLCWIRHRFMLLMLNTSPEKRKNVKLVSAMGCNRNVLILIIQSQYVLPTLWLFTCTGITTIIVYLISMLTKIRALFDRTWWWCWIRNVIQ